jgi:hypothetical protein
MIYIRHVEAVMTDSTAHEPQSPVSLVLALLDERWPSIAALDDGPAGDILVKLASDPRYLVGRLQQAMTVLLADDLPPVDPQSALLSQALDDALAWRTHQDRHCAQCDELRDELREQCNADYDQASRYHELARALGVVGDSPCAVPREYGQPVADQDDSAA